MLYRYKSIELKENAIKFNTKPTNPKTFLSARASLFPQTFMNKNVRKRFQLKQNSVLSQLRILDVERRHFIDHGQWENDTNR